MGMHVPDNSMCQAMWMPLLEDSACVSKCVKVQERACVSIYAYGEDPACAQE
jgi:hypothetical protein